MATVESSKNELIRRYAVVDDKVKDLEMTIEKLTNELDMERDQMKKTWEQDSETQNR